MAFIYLHEGHLGGQPISHWAQAIQPTWKGPIAQPKGGWLVASWTRPILPATQPISTGDGLYSTAIVHKWPQIARKTLKMAHFSRKTAKFGPFWPKKADFSPKFRIFRDFFVIFRDFSQDSVISGRNSVTPWGSCYSLRPARDYLAAPWDYWPAPMGLRQ